MNGQRERETLFVVGEFLWRGYGQSRTIRGAGDGAVENGRAGRLPYRRFVALQV